MLHKSICVPKHFMDCVIIFMFRFDFITVTQGQLMRVLDESDVEYMPVTFVSLFAHLNKLIPGFSTLSNLDQVQLPDCFNFKSVLFDYFENIITEQKMIPGRCSNSACDIPVDYGSTWYFTNL